MSVLERVWNYIFFHNYSEDLSSLLFYGIELALLKKLDVTSYKIVNNLSFISPLNPTVVSGCRLYHAFLRNQRG